MLVAGVKFTQALSALKEKVKSDPPVLVIVKFWEEGRGSPRKAEKLKLEDTLNEGAVSV